MERFFFTVSNLKSVPVLPVGPLFCIYFFLLHSSWVTVFKYKVFNCFFTNTYWVPVLICGSLLKAAGVFKFNSYFRKPLVSSQAGFHKPLVTSWQNLGKIINCSGLPKSTFGDTSGLLKTASRFLKRLLVRICSLVSFCKEAAKKFIFKKLVYRYYRYA